MSADPLTSEAGELLVPGDRTLMPLDVFLRLMRHYWAIQNHSVAANYAKLAAPFLHPRAPAAAAPMEPGDMTDEELRAWIQADDAAAADT